MKTQWYNYLFTAFIAFTSFNASANIFAEHELQDAESTSEYTRYSNYQPVYRKGKAESFYMQAGFGMPEYTNISSISSLYSANIGFGSYINRNLSLDVSYTRAEFDVDLREQHKTYFLDNFSYLNPAYGAAESTNMIMNQNTVAATAKYEFFAHKALRPVLGVQLGFTQRNYQIESQLVAEDQTLKSIYDDSTNAMDLGLIFGGEWQVSKNFSLGSDFLLNTNVNNNSKSSSSMSYVGSGLQTSRAEFEAESYYILNLRLKYIL